MPVVPRRLTSSREFRALVRNGARAGTGALVVHALDAEVSSYGLVVSKAVGGAVDRNRVKRRLRPLVSTQLRERTSGQAVVIRALPGAAGMSSAELARALDSCLRRAAARQAHRAHAP